MPKTMKRIVAAGLLAGLAGVVGGCGITGDSVRANWSPELHSTARSFEQHRNMEARTIDLNGRGAWDDGARLLLLDKPSDASPYPIP
ncbi:MAG TPA: hypothetical protein VF184_08560 [Phycisphaeraceae bacterium]